jgi:exonuclease SbcD
MRIVHIADTHLGFRQLQRVDDVGRNVREQDVYDAFGRAITKAIELAPAAVVHAGDLFDSHHPSAAALRVALDGFARLRDAGIPLVVIAGNHCTPRAASAEHVFRVLEHFGAEVIHDAAKVVRIGALSVHAIPHGNDRAQIMDALRAARPVPQSEFNVLAAHVGLDGLRDLDGGEARAVRVPEEALSGATDFDYIALGHRHRFAAVRGNGAYSGSLERLSWADAAPQKGLVEVNLDADRTGSGYRTLHSIDGRPHLTLAPIDAARVDDLTDAIVGRAASVGAERLRGAMVRLSLRNVRPADWNAADHRAIADAFGGCLHFERELDLVAAPITSRVAGAAGPALGEFLRDWPKAPAGGVDLDEFVARGEAFVAQASQEPAA